MLPIMPTLDVPIWLNSVLLHTTVENTTETRVPPLWNFH